MCIQTIHHFFSRLPFDWKNPFGYFIAVVVEIVILSHIMKITACLIVFAIGFYLHAVGACKRIKEILSAIDQSAKRPANKQKIAFEQFDEFIRFDSRLKQLSIYAQR